MALSAVASVLTVVMGVLAHAVRHELSWAFILTARASVSLLVAYLAARRAGHRLVFRAPRAMWVRSVAGAVLMGAFSYAYTALPASDVLVISNTFPLWLALVSVVVFGQRLHASVLAAIFLVLGGVALLERPHLEAGLGLGIALAASVGLALVTIVLSRLRGVPSTVVAGHYFFVALVTGAAVLVAQAAGGAHLAAPSSVSPATWLALLGVGVSGAVAQIVYTRACQLGRSTRVALVSMVDAPLACVVDAALGSRSFDLWSLVGIALVLAPTVHLVLQPAESCHVVVAAVAAPEPAALDAGEAERPLLAAIAHLERETACELRIHVEPGDEPRAERAEALFGELAMTGTLRRNGLLLVLWPRAGALAVVADEGISDVISRRSLLRALRPGGGAPGAERARGAGAEIVAAAGDAVERLTRLLAPVFPHPVDDTNELPDLITWGHRDS